MRIILGMILAGSISSAAQAQTASEIRICYGDAVRLCGATTINPSFFERLRIQVCMLAHRDDVSPACRAVFVAHGL